MKFPYRRRVVGWSADGTVGNGRWGCGRRRRNRGAMAMAQAFNFLIAIVCGPDARQTCSGSRGGEFGDALFINNSLT